MSKADMELNVIEKFRWFLVNLTPAGRRRRLRKGWELKWANPKFDAPWLGRGVSKEIVAAVEEGWFRPGAKAIDLGCGEGEPAAWLAEQGFQTLGVDIAAAAIERARARFGAGSPLLSFAAHDMCAGPPPGGPFEVLVDRGCFHQIPFKERPAYRRNLAIAAAPDARLLLFHRAFRTGEALGDPEERRRVTEQVEAGLGHAFSIEKSAETYLDPCGGRDPARAMGGMVYWMRRRN